MVTQKSWTDFTQMFADTRITLLLCLAFSSQTAVLAQQKPSIDKETAKQKNLGTLKAIPNTAFSKGIPDNFPVRAYPKNVVESNFVAATKGAPSAAACIVTKDAADVVDKWYQDQLRSANFAVKTPTPKLMNQIGKQGQLYIINASKDQQRVSIFTSRTPTGSTIQISWSKVQ